MAARSAKVRIKYSSTGYFASDNISGVETNSNGAAIGTTYAVKSGDTLWAIAKKFLGSGNKYTEIYELNKEVIEQAAKNHNKVNSDNGHWIWAGTVLQIPAVPTENVLDSGASSSPVVRGVQQMDESEYITSQVTSFSYTDVASGKSDSVSMTLMDVNKEWMGSKMPTRGAGIQAAINTTDWGQGAPSFYCGRFILDEVSFSGRPLSCNLSAVSIPLNNDFKTKQKSITWQSTTLRDVAEKIAKSTGVKLYYSGNSIKIVDLEQSDKTDSAFLAELCEKYGFSIKVFNNKIVIFDTVEAEAKASVLQINEKDMLSWSYNASIDGTYTGIEFSYNNPDTKAKDKKIKLVIGKAGRMYTAHAQAANQYDAELQAKALLNKANRSAETMTVSIRANNTIVAGQCVSITGLGKINGKYYIDQIKHSVGTGYNMQLTLHKVQGGIK